MDLNNNFRKYLFEPLDGLAHN